MFAASYSALPACEWLMYRWIVRIPPSGFAILLRKRIGNDLLLGFAGEVHFYAWLRSRPETSACAFAVVKDMTVLSAVTANAATVVVAFAAWPLLAPLLAPVGGWTRLAAAVVIGGPSLVALIFRGRVFSGDRRRIGGIAVGHAARLVLTTVLTAATWWLALPGGSIAWTLPLAALRLVVSRLPFVPNRDVVFAGVVAGLVGSAAAVTDMLVMLAVLTLIAHLAVGTVLPLGGAVSGRRR